MHTALPMRARVSLVLVGFVTPAAVGCQEPSSVAAVDHDVRLDTRAPAARSQYEANVAFAATYTARCTRGDDEIPRVLVTGFGRFADISNNVTGRVVSALVPGLVYPEGGPPAAGQVDPPGASLRVASAVVDLPGVGPARVCGMILPVYWDLAAILVAREIDAFEPSFVAMNGVAGAKQPLWIELGSANRAAALPDGSGQLRPDVPAGESVAKIVPNAAPDEETRPNLLSWSEVKSAAGSAIEDAARANDRGGFSDILRGAVLAGYPRSSSTYLCNNISYATGWLMSHPKETTTLLEASEPRDAGRPEGVPVSLTYDARDVPRVFTHWPSGLREEHYATGAVVLSAMLGAQLQATLKGARPTPGDNANAEPGLRGGSTF